jgi:hypothetical protein
MEASREDEGTACFRMLAYSNFYFRFSDLSSVKYKDSRVSLC